MKRDIVNIDKEKCNGCGLCVKACHECAIELQNGKAVLIRDDYCDGMGDCLPECPTGAIKITKREALAYDEEAVKENIKKNSMKENNSFQCPGSMMRELKPRKEMDSDFSLNISSQLKNWPVQIKLAPIKAQYFQNAKLLIAADCTAYAYANFHKDFIKGKVTIIGCPKLDSIDYSEKLTEIIKNNDIQSITIVRMEVPCCGGLENAAKVALQNSGKFIPWNVVTISIDGRIID